MSSTYSPFPAIGWLLMLLLVCTSCSSISFFQVIETASKNSTAVDGYHMFENDDIQVIYDFWEKGGRVSFRISNKSEVPIYIDWTKSHLIYNGISHDYWSDKETTTSFYFSNSASYGTSNSTVQYNDWGATLATVLSGRGKTHSQTTTVRARPKQVTHLPPHSSINLEGSRIMTSAIFDCDFNWATVKRTKNSKRTYTSEASPLQFSNYLTYTTEASITEPKVMENEFYISSAEFVSKKAYYGSSERVEKCTAFGLSEVELMRTRSYQKGISWYLIY